MKQNQFGRSMIEMLGVLAIIGVLSVGGIAGYSKAMEKWKINKATEDYSYLIHGLLSNLDEARKQQSSDSLVSLVEYVKAAGIVPETWKEEQIDSRRMSDPYGNIIQFFVRNNNVVLDMFIGSNNTEDGDISICHINLYFKKCQPHNGRTCTRLNFYSFLVVPLN